MRRLAWIIYSLGALALLLDPVQLALGFVPRLVWPILQLAATTCLAITLIYGPGLLWLQRRNGAADLALATFAGPLALAALGLACWALGGVIVPMTLARIGIAGLLLAIGWGLWRTRAHPRLPVHAAPVIGGGMLLIGFAVAKANLSYGPAGELYDGKVSRTLEVGGHSDSRISYHLVQLVARHVAPFSEEAGAYYSPWSFASRGPVAGLVAAPVVLGTGAIIGPDAPNQPWRPFDPQGFSTYRITQIVLASLAGWAVFGAVAMVAAAEWALVAAVVALLSPFFVHEMYFTWPKLAAAAFVLSAFVLGQARRPVAAGLSMAMAYLLHPLALFSVPFLALWLLVRDGREQFGWRRLAVPALFTFTVLGIATLWMQFGRFAPLRTGSQTVFLDYFRLANGSLPDSAMEWWVSRWNNFANTFIPFYLQSVDRSDESINSVYGPSDAWVQTGFLYWNTLPFALGLPAFLLILVGLDQACRRAFAVVGVMILGPALFLILYWGAASTGLMRHCGQVLFVSVIVAAVWSLARWPGGQAKTAVGAFLHPACFVWRGLEIAVMAFGTTLLSARPRLAGPYGWNDVISLAIAAVCLTAVTCILAKTSGPLRARLFSPQGPPMAADQSNAHAKI